MDLTFEAPTPQNGQTHSNNSLVSSVFYHFVGLGLKSGMIFKKATTNNYKNNCSTSTIYFMPFSSARNGFESAFVRRLLNKPWKWVVGFTPIFFLLNIWISRRKEKKH